MNLEQFTQRFPDEASCRDHWKIWRERKGLACYKCGGNKLYWNKTNIQWRCANCKCPTSLRKGTVMEDSNLPFLFWYKAIFMLKDTDSWISVKEMQRQLEHKYYQPIWMMMKKIRNSKESLIGQFD